MLGLLDIISTYIIMKYAEGGELNPIMNHIFNTYGVSISLFIKLIVSLLIYYWLYKRISEKTNIYILVGLILTMCIYAFYLLKYNGLIFIC